MTRLASILKAGFAAVFIASLGNCMGPGSVSIPSEDLSDYPTAAPLKERRFELERVSLHAMENGNPAKPTVVFIHGTPGQWSMFRSYLNHPRLQDHARLFSISRPSWAGSTVKGSFLPTLGDQSAMLGEWLCQMAAESTNGKLLVVAHSYGATLTPRLAMDHPACVSGMILLAGAADPDLAQPRWYNRMTSLWPIATLVGGLSEALVQSNHEMMQVAAELESMRPRWNSLQLPTTVFQGEQDPLVHADNADFIEESLSHIPATVHRYQEEGHFVLRSHQHQVVDEILSMLSVLEP
ncbi:MAG: hypothetical protein DHS20C12_26900 [Pseudohongiella sp.]|nr:MAG: hypothetical protein DHS20C12_26900 [Pseudohongiella sp.]